MTPYRLHTTHSRRSFTLVEILIVIVIIGILAAALIPRIRGVQERARDTARMSDLRELTSAIELYHADYGSYPAPSYTAHRLPDARLSSVMIPSTYAQGAGGSTIDTIASDLSSYMSSIPLDPAGAGVQAAGDGSCIDAGDSYGYTSDGDTYYAVTALSESQKGNASACGDTIDHTNDGPYQKQGEGLVVSDVSAYPSESEWTDPEEFEFDKDTGTITDYTGPKRVAVVIPAEIDGVAVQNIGGSAFRNKTLTSVTIPDSVTSIGDRAFRSSAFTSVTIPDSVTSIGYGAFYGNNLTSMTIPDSVTSIGREAFSHNALTSVTIPDSVTSIGYGAFYRNALTSVTIPDSVTSIKGHTFNRNALTSVTIPDSVTSIGQYAFYRNNLTSVTIPDSVTSIGQYAFYRNNLTSVTIPDSVTSIGAFVFYMNGPNSDNTSNIPQSPIEDVHGTWNLEGGQWVKE